MSRITQVHRILKQKHLDAIIILSDYNRRYLSGFTGTSGALIISKDKQYLITDFRYIDQATKQAPNYEIINRKSTIIGEIKELLHQENFENVGFEGHHVSYDTYLELNKSRISLISISNTVDKIRDVKDADEIALIQKAANIVD
ncbi:creatinase, partial [Staphylococcus aureus subsp. aureus 21194]